jgi:protein-disulfide isomerase
LRFFRAAALSVAFLVAGCHAQQPATNGPQLPSDTQKRIVEQLRQSFNVPPDVDVALGAAKSSEFPSYDKVPVTFSRGGRVTTVDFLLSQDRKTLVRMEKFDLTKVKLPEEVAKEFKAKEPTLIERRPVRGNPNAAVTIVNFDDFQCPYCSVMHKELFPGLFDQYKDKIKIVYVDFPLNSIHPWAMHAAIDANCLAAQNNDAYWEFADRVHGNQQSIGASHDVKQAEVEVDKITHEIAGKHSLADAALSACMAKNDKSAVEKSMAAGTSLGVESTPTLFINGTKVEGAVSESMLKQAIDDALKPPSPQTK